MTEPRTRANRLRRPKIRCKGVGNDRMMLTCPRCGWPCEYLVRPYFGGEWAEHGGFCGECVLEAVSKFDRDGWPADPLAGADFEVDLTALPEPEQIELLL